VFVSGEDRRRRDPRFVLEKGAKGLSAPKIEGKLSLRAVDHRHGDDGRVKWARDALLPTCMG
jgi:glutaryl-CoA dehydrogenase